MNTDEAYLRCEAITRRNAANFYYGIRLLAPERRRAMCAVYAFARRIDDIGDGSLPAPRKLELLSGQAAALALLPGGVPRAGADRTNEDDPVLVALADTYVRFEVPTDAMPALIAGVTMDVEGIAYETFGDLVLYCRRVAGAIGRACLAIFALRDRAGAERTDVYRLADDLGVALQLTNILRDIREDAQAGRVYLPGEDLRRFGLIAAGEEPSAAATLARLAQARGPHGRGPNAGDRNASDRNASGRNASDRNANGRNAGGRHAGGRHAAGRGASRWGGRGRGADGGNASARNAADAEEAQWLDALVRFQAARAREWFDRGMALAPLLDRRSAGCLLAMSGIYSRLLDRIESEPDRALRERVSLPVHEKALVAVRGLLGARV
jgi:phytoene/squalene synthetase